MALPELRGSDLFDDAFGDAIDAWMLVPSGATHETTFGAIRYARAASGRWRLFVWANGELVPRVVEGDPGDDALNALHAALVGE